MLIKTLSLQHLYGDDATKTLQSYENFCESRNKLPVFFASSLNSFSTRQNQRISVRDACIYIKRIARARVRIINNAAPFHVMAAQADENQSHCALVATSLQ